MFTVPKIIPKVKMSFWKLESRNSALMLVITSSFSSVPEEELGGVLGFSLKKARISKRKQIPMIACQNCD